MKFLIDECMGKKFHNLLSRKGFDTIFVGDWKLGASDVEVIKFAVILQ